MTILRNVTLAKNDLGYDAWGRPKVITDYSIFNGLWTFSVDNRVWLQYNDIGAGYIEQTAIDNNLVKSTNGYLQVTGNSTTDVLLTSKRNPRYQPNRGYLYSSAVIVPDPIFVGTRQFGLITLDNGIFFEVVGDSTNYILNIVRRTSIAGVLSEERVDITANLPAGFDISKGHVYDIQIEWRGVGNFYIYIDLTLVYTFNLLGTLTGMSVSNPAMPVGWVCKDSVGVNDLILIAGCVDVTSEGGTIANKQYTSINTGTTLLSTTNAGVGILALRLLETITYDGQPVRYTRDMVLKKFITFCKDEAFTILSTARLLHTPNLLALAGWTTSPSSLYEFRTNSDGALDTAYQLDKASMVDIYTTRTEKDFSIEHEMPDSEVTPFFLTGGDIVIISIKSDAASKAGANMELSEEL